MGDAEKCLQRLRLRIDVAKTLIAWTEPRTNYGLPLMDGGVGCLAGSFSLDFIEFGC